MILVTGATGFVGRHLVDALVARGDSVRALVRAGRDTAMLPTGVEVVEGDLLDAVSVEKAAAGCAVIVHAGGDYRGDDDELWRVHTEGTANVLAAADPGSRVILLSSTSVYGWNRDWPANEDTPPRPITAYGAAKLAAEQLVLGWQRGDGVVARSTIVYGPGDEGGMLTRAESLLRAGVRWFPGTGTNRVHLTHVDDLVAGLVALTTEGSGVYLFAGPRPTPIGVVLRGLADALGLAQPTFVGRLAARAARLLDRHAVEVLTEDRAFAPMRAARDLGWSPKVDLDAGLATLARPFTPAETPGPEWERFVQDHDEGLGSVYERFVLSDVIDQAIESTGAASVLHGPLFGMTGVPGLDLIFQARRGVPVGLLDVDADRLAAVVELWRSLGCEPDRSVVAPWPDTSAWAGLVPEDSYDLVVSFAALWWCESPWEVLAAQARWARKGVLLCVPNRNVFMRVRARFWHKDMFDHLNLDAIDRAEVERQAERIGLRLVDTGLFDIPPFPDIAISVKQLVPAVAAQTAAETESDKEGWRWDVVPYLRGEDDELPGRITKLRFFEERVAGRAAVATRLAHHRYWLFVPR